MLDIPEQLTPGDFYNPKRCDICGFEGATKRERLAHQELCKHVKPARAMERLMSPDKVDTLINTLVVQPYQSILILVIY